MSERESDLPPLPPSEPVMVQITQGNRCAVHGTYTADQMTEYAEAAYRAGVAAERERLAGCWRTGYALATRTTRGQT